MDKVQSFNVEERVYTFVQMDKWIEKSKYLMALCQDNNVVIQKYYWRSIFDENYIEYFEPMIIDAYTMCIDISGRKEDILFVLEEYNKVKDDLEKLNIIEPYTEEEIKTIADKAFQHMYMFNIQ